MWLLISSIFVSKNSLALENTFIFIILILSSYSLYKTALVIENYNNIFKIFSISLIFSVSLVILDSTLNLGLKIWLGKNLDFSNFKNYYSLKSWVSLESFKKDNLDVINNHIGNTYDRGIASIAVLSIPISRICYQLNYKPLAFLVIFMSLMLISLGHNQAALGSYLIVGFLCTILFYFKKTFYKIFILFFGFYFLFIPLILGPADYKKLNSIENINEIKFKRSTQTLFLMNNCSSLNSVILYLDGGMTLANKEYANKDVEYSRKKIRNNADVRGYKFCKKYNSYTNSQKNLEAAKILFNYYTMRVKIKITHRMVIWSFVKNKIFEKPLFGHGFSSSRIVGEQFKFKNIYQESMNIMPLHPHNGILQIWLELGFLGILIALFLVLLLLKKIKQHSKNNFTNAAFAITSVCQVFFIGQISYGAWQIWWLSLIVYCVILYGVIFNYKKPRSN